MTLLQGNTGDWEMVIGLEVHAQASSQAKLFSGAATAFGAEPNTQVSLVDAAMPGMLPVINEIAVEQAVRTGLGLKAQINLVSVFDRKNYFYADLPQGYQISQFSQPIVGKGTIILDLGLPDADGLDMLRSWRDAGVETSVLILTACDGIDDRVRGLNSGGDDYLLKPFAMEELVARIRVLLRRPGEGSRFGDYHRQRFLRHHGPRGAGQRQDDFHSQARIGGTRAPDAPRQPRRPQGRARRQDLRLRQGSLVQLGRGSRFAVAQTIGWRRRQCQCPYPSRRRLSVVRRKHLSPPINRVSLFPRRHWESPDHA